MAPPSCIAVMAKANTAVVHRSISPRTKEYNKMWIIAAPTDMTCKCHRHRSTVEVAADTFPRWKTIWRRGHDGHRAESEQAREGARGRYRKKLKCGHRQQPLREHESAQISMLGDTMAFSASWHQKIDSRVQQHHLTGGAEVVSPGGNSTIPVVFFPRKWTYTPGGKLRFKGTSPNKCGGGDTVWGERSPGPDNFINS